MTNHPYRMLVALAVLTACTGEQVLAQIVLTINRDSGAVSIRNDNFPASIEIDGYEITSLNGLLNQPGWLSFSDNLIAGWEEAPTSSATVLAEFNPNVGQSVAITSGQTVSLGNAYTTDPSAAMAAVGFGNPFEDVTFSVADAVANDVVAGVVEFTGQERFNNLVLEITTATGAARLINESPETVAIDFYQVTSPDAVLQTGFDGLTQGGSPVAGWETGGTNTANGLAQFFPVPSGGFSVAGGEEFDLGVAFDPGNASRDVDLLFHIVGGADAGFAGEVRFIEPAGVIGDYNNNGVVDAADYTVWRDNLGSGFQLPNEDPSLTPGQVTVEDYEAWRNNFGNSAALASVAAAPEPAAAVLGLIALVFPLQRSRRN